MSDDVPKPDPVLDQPVETRRIGKLFEIFLDDPADQPPEDVSRMRVILPGGERCVSGQAAQDEQPRVFSGDRGKSEFLFAVLVQPVPPFAFVRATAKG
jgi:hypothetical protein